MHLKPTIQFVLTASHPLAGFLAVPWNFINKQSQISASPSNKELQIDFTTNCSCRRQNRSDGRRSNEPINVSVNVITSAHGHQAKTSLKLINSRKNVSKHFRIIVAAWDCHFNGSLFSWTDRLIHGWENIRSGEARNASKHGITCRSFLEKLALKRTTIC